LSTKNSGYLTTSWDDGHPRDLRIAELLAKFSLSGTFYVPLENSRRVMAPGEIRELSGGFEVGAHTVHHAVLTQLGASEAETEIADSRKRLQEITGKSCDTFCFPRGRFQWTHLDMVRRAGFRGARTVELLSTRLPSRYMGIALLPTTVQINTYSWTAYARNCLKQLRAQNMLHFFRYARSRNWVETARPLLRRVAERGGVFHLWGHSWEIEEQQQWLQLESFLREMGEWRKSLPCMTNSHLCSIAQTVQPNSLPLVDGSISSARSETGEPAPR